MSFKKELLSLYVDNYGGDVSNFILRSSPKNHFFIVSPNVASMILWDNANRYLMYLSDNNIILTDLEKCIAARYIRKLFSDAHPEFKKIFNENKKIWRHVKESEYFND